MDAKGWRPASAETNRCNECGEKEKQAMRDVSMLERLSFIYSRATTTSSLGIPRARTPVCAHTEVILLRTFFKHVVGLFSAFPLLGWVFLLRLARMSLRLAECRACAFGRTIWCMVRNSSRRIGIFVWNTVFNVMRCFHHRNQRTIL